MEQNFLVGTGIVTLPTTATDPRAAIEQVKARIDARRHQQSNDEIGMSLVEALDAGRLNFIVMLADRSAILAGEYQGVYEEPATRHLADALISIIPTGLYYTTKCD